MGDKKDSDVGNNLSHDVRCVLSAAGETCVPLTELVALLKKYRFLTCAQLASAVEKKLQDKKESRKDNLDGQQQL